MKLKAAGLFTVVFLTIHSTQAFAQLNIYVGGPGSSDPPVTVGGGWQFFQWSAGPNVFNAEGPWTFSSGAATVLSITDGGVVGDQFSLFDSGSLFGSSSSVANNGFDNETLTPDQYFADPAYSHGVFNLGPGSHSITIETIVIATGFPIGGAYFRVDPVPEPATLSLLALGLGLGLACYSKTARKSPF